MAVDAGLVGLTSIDAAARLSEHGPNTLPQQRRTTLLQRLVLQLRDPLIIVLLAAAALTIATGDHTDAVIIAVVITANTTVGVAQEVKADAAIAALRSMTAAEARVMRDGSAMTVSAGSIVPGDVVIVGEGDIVPADAELIDAAALLVDESAMTGESVPVAKDVSDDASGELASGTLVVHGRGVATVTRTGADSAMGRVASHLASGPSLTPLQRRLAALGRTLAGVAVVLSIVVMTIGLIRGEPAELMILTTVSLVVAAVPESLPAVVTLSLALGARRMAARHAIVRRLPAVETLGSVTVVATDKTGTLTEGAMVAETVWTTTREAVLTGTGFDPHGEVLDDSGPLGPSTAPSVTELLTAAVLCNDASLRAPAVSGDRWQAVGDPTEAALLAAAAKLPLDVTRLRDEHPRLMELPFDSARKRMSTVHRRPDGRIFVACKGAPEAVLDAETLRDDAGTLATARAKADAYADLGFRVLAIATATLDHPPRNPGEVEHQLALAGLVAFADPPRAAAFATVEACRAAGITPVLITGDHVATARNIAERLGISPPDGPTAVGDQIGADVPSPRAVSVYARTDPSQKLGLISKWQAAGEVVAMTGDGVNDAPALRRADIGVAMGRRGTEIARQAADMVLTDDDLGTIVAAVEEGRRVYANVRRFLLYALAGGAAEILVMMIGPAVGLALPLLPAQILWVNLLTHGLPGVAMGAEPAEPDLMRRPPRPAAESVIGGGLWVRVLLIAAVVAATSLGSGLWVRGIGRPWQSAVFLALGMAQFGVAVGVRARPGSWTNPFLPLAIGLSFLLQLAGIYAPPLRSVLETHALRPIETVVICSAAVAGYLAARAVRHLRLGSLDSGSRHESRAESPVMTSQRR